MGVILDHPNELEGRGQLHASIVFPEHRVAILSQYCITRSPGGYYKPVLYPASSGGYSKPVLYPASSGGYSKPVLYPASPGSEDWRCIRCDTRSPWVWYWITQKSWKEEVCIKGNWRCIRCDTGSPWVWYWITQKSWRIEEVCIKVDWRCIRCDTGSPWVWCWSNQKSWRIWLLAGCDNGSPVFVS